jgi:Fe-S oxidoreductase
MSAADPTLPLRETFWNIPLPAIVFVYVGGFIALGIFGWRMWRRVALWRAGVPEDRFGDWGIRTLNLLREGLFQTRILTQRLPGVMHALLLWGFLVLLLGTILATIDWEITRLLFDWRLLKGEFYLAYEAALDGFGLLLLVALGIASWRRYVKRPARLSYDHRFAEALTILFVLALSGFVMEAARLAVVQPAWAPWSFAGWALAQAFLALGLTEPVLRGIHLWVWLGHALLTFVFIARIPSSYFQHMVATPLNIFFAKLTPRGELKKIDNLEEQETFGVSRFEQFSWKRRLDFDACTECGRCHDICCAQRSGAVLDPKQVIVKLKRYMHEGGGTTIEGKALHGDVITADELWGCTTCGACLEVCPARIDIVDTIVDMRRHLALEHGEFPPGAAHTLHNIQRLGNPWGMDPADRLSWAAGLDVPLMEPGKPVQYLYWVGCSAAFDQRNHHIARSMVKILRAANISFGVMAEERCHAEVGRRLGEEYLFQTAAEENAANMKQYTFDRILVHCPHCMNTIRHEYPQFDATYEVVHHTTLIADLLAHKTIAPKLAQHEQIALHDPCYLGRHNGEYEAPRAVLAAVGNATTVELAANRERATCCGGGGGQMWTETHARKRINIIRSEEILASGAKTVAVGCPHCLTMLDSGAASLDAKERMKVRDLAEIVADAL